MIVSVIRNRAYYFNESILETTERGMANRGKLDPKLVKVVSEALKEDVGCKYLYWINFDIATDKKQIEFAKKAKYLGLGRQVAKHFFF